MVRMAYRFETLLSEFDTLVSLALAHDEYEHKQRQTTV